MYELMRVRALDEVEPNLGRWRVYNGLFRSFIPIFTSAFDRGEQANLDYYVTRTIGDNSIQEEKVLGEVFGVEREPGAKITILEGQVGSGKTCFMRYIIEKLLPNLLPSAVGIRVDVRTANNIFGSNPDTLDRAFVESTETTLCDGPQKRYKSQKEYLQAVFIQLGYEIETDSEIFSSGKKIIARDIIHFLQRLDDVSHILVVIDNSDDSSGEMVKCADSFATNLATDIRIRDLKPVGIVLPLREYSLRYYDVEAYAQIELFPVDTADVLKRMVEEARDLIEKTVREYRQSFTSTFMDAGSPDGTRSEGRTVVITKESAIEFLVELAQDIFGKHDHEVQDFLDQLCGKNIMELTRNAFNIIHSAKLPLAPLFRRHFRPPDALESRSDRKIFSKTLAVECLMAIHYPFFDIENSRICNIFNARCSYNSGDFRNTLVIPRLLCLISNLGSVQYNKVIDRFDGLTYSSNYVNQAIKICLDYGLISASHGISMNDFNSTTVLSCLSGTEVYLNYLVSTPSYLQHACEDTPMENEFVVPVADKYNIDNLWGDVEKRMDSVEKLIDFVKHEEELEAKTLSLSRDAKKAFLIEMGISDGEVHRSISDVLELEARPAVDDIRKAARRKAQERQRKT